MDMFFNHIMYSDIEPCEVVKVISEKCCVIKRMKATLVNKEDLKFCSGGFVAHCSNQDNQKWLIESDDKATEFRIRLHKDGVWRDKGGDRYKNSDKPIKFYDYNF